MSAHRSNRGGTAVVAFLALAFLYVAVLAADDWINGFETRTIAGPGAGEHPAQPAGGGLIGAGTVGSIACHDRASIEFVAVGGRDQRPPTPPAWMLDECGRQYDRFTSVRCRLSVLALGLAGCLALAARRPRSSAST